MTAALKLNNMALAPAVRQFDPQVCHRLTFHGRENEPESKALTQFREGALMLLKDCRRWRVENGYSALLRLVVDLACERIEKCYGHQKTHLVLQLVHLLRLVSMVEIQELELATAELQGEVAIMLAGETVSEKSVPWRPVSPRAMARQIESSIHKKLHAFLAELSAMTNAADA